MKSALATVANEPALDEGCVNTLRFLSIDAVQNADSGHPGMPMGAAAMAFTLWDRFLKHNPKNPNWFNRDRFILSAGHGSMLLYSLLHLTGYDVSIDDLKQFRQWESKTPGHPERGETPGVEMTTGPLGQGFANGVGLAMAERHLAALYNKEGFEIVDHHVYAIVSDGDLMEGVASEAASLAGHLKLGKLIYLYDDNRVTLSAGTDIAFTEDGPKRFQSYGWHVQTVDDGNDIHAIDMALRAAREETEKPSIICVRTHIGFGSPNKHDSFEAHGSPLGKDEVKLTKENLGWPLEPSFLVPEEEGAHMMKAVERGVKAEKEWEDKFRAYQAAFPDLAKDFKLITESKLPEGWDADIPVFPADPKGVSTRVAGGKVMNAIAGKLPALFGGSADLNPSTMTELKGLGDFEPKDTVKDKQGAAQGGMGFAGRNIYFGVREHAMGSIANGIAAHSGMIPFASTFLIFSDYMRPPMRLASLMKLHVIYVFTHDSVALGQDGPTHQPIEQLVGLRSVPDFITLRPADANETAVAWRVAIEAVNQPVALILTRQNLPTIDRTKYASADGVRKGAYIVSEAEGGKPDVILMATGSEVGLAISAQEKLKEKSIKARVVSMPSWELFNKQDKAYRDTVLPPGVHARLAIEMATSLGWHRYVGDKGAVLSIDHFGASAPAERLLKEFGFSVENVCAQAEALLKAQ